MLVHFGPCWSYPFILVQDVGIPEKGEEVQDVYFRSSRFERLE